MEQRALLQQTHPPAPTRRRDRPPLPPPPRAGAGRGVGGGGLWGREHRLWGGGPAAPAMPTPVWSGLLPLPLPSPHPPPSWDPPASDHGPAAPSLLPALREAVSGASA